MAGISWFQDGTYTRKQLRQLIGALVGGKTSARPLGGHSGLTAVPTLSVSSTTWTVGPFTGILDLETDATMGPSPFVFGTSQTGSVTAASASIDRWDLLSITMDDATPTLPTIVYTAGSVAATLPATPAESIALAKIVVPKSGTGSPTITLIAPQAAASGGVLPCASSSEYPASPRTGACVYDASLDQILRYTGSAWDAVGAATGTVTSTNTDANGYITVTHGLPWTPSAVNVTVTTDNPTAVAGVLSVSAIGSTTFKVRFWRFAAASASHWVVDNLQTGATGPVTFTWTAHP